MTGATPAGAHRGRRLRRSSAGLRGDRGTRGTCFTEVLEGHLRLAGEDRARRVRLELTVAADTVLDLRRTVTAQTRGRLRVEGWANDVPVTGLLEIAPLSRRRIAYRIDFTVDGTAYTLDGWKSVELRRPVRSMTVLPYALLLRGTDEGLDSARTAEPAGTGELRFVLRRELLPFLASFRFPAVPGKAPALPGADDASTRAWRPRWDGRPGRAEVWYTTFTDLATGTGVWLHHETTAPTDGGAASAHGFLAVFPAGGPVEVAHFTPTPLRADPDGFRAGDVRAVPGRLHGSAGPWTWDLRESPEAGRTPLFTFPRWAWERELLPAAHLVVTPGARYHGTLSAGDRRIDVHDARGASARIYGHGSAERWAWLHADLGDGDVLEVVAAVSRRPGLNRLPPLVFLRLRRDGRLWPRSATRSAFGSPLLLGVTRFRARIGLPEWTVTGRAGLRRITVAVRQPMDRIAEVEYTDPDGSSCVCRNTEQADAVVELHRRRLRGGWRPEARWVLHGTAHAEVGGR